MPILLLALVCGGVLLWLFGRVHHEHEPVKQHWATEIGDLSRLGYFKHAMAAEYAHFAGTAEKEQATGAARLFHALARSEQVQEMGCAEAVRRLGGHYTPPSRIIVFRSTTSANLSRAIEQELHNYQYYRDGSIDSAVRSGNRYAARILIRTAGGDMRHIELLKCFTNHPLDGGYAVCPLCGNIFRMECCDIYCPFCQTPATKFIRFE